MMFNVNHHVRVKLTPEGLAHHRKRWGEVFAGTHYEYTPPETDADGWSRWQMHDLMHTFGSEMTCGMNSPFETTIEIIEGQ